MADFSNVVITEKGKSLIAKLQGNQDTLIFTTIKTSSKVYSKEDLYNLSNIEFIKQQRAINKVNYESPNMIKIVCKLDNKDITESGYNLCSYGIYAKSEKNLEEILFAAVSTNDISKADWISPSSALNAITINLNTVLIVSNVEVAEVTISDEGVIAETFNEHVNSKGINAVHGATDEAEAGAIVSRGVDGSAQIEYPTKPTDKTIVNKKALDTALSNLNIDAGVPQEAVINYYMPNAIYKIGDVVAIETTMAERVPTVKPSEPEPEPSNPEQPANPDDNKDNTGEKDNTGDSGNSGTTEPDTPSGDTERVKVVSIGDTIQVGAAIYEAIDNVYEDEGFTDIKTNPTKYPDIWQFKRWALS